MMIQRFTGFPLPQQTETVFVFDIAKNAEAYATRLLCRRFDQGQKGLDYFQLLFGMTFMVILKTIIMVASLKC